MQTRFGKGFSIIFPLDSDPRCEKRIRRGGKSSQVCPETSTPRVISRPPKENRGRGGGKKKKEGKSIARALVDNRISN